MASIEKEKKKRKSASLDCETKKSHGTKSRKNKTKETTKTRTHESKKDKHGRSHGASSDRHKVRNISELAKLVASGKVKIPQSLESYGDDKPVLLDQLFTILTPNDIKGMLPDILKGLKTKQVKRLCYEQLQKMDTETIKMIIRGEAVQRTIEPEEESNEEIDKTVDLEETGSTSGQGRIEDLVKIKEGSGQGQSESATEEQETHDPDVSDISDDGEDGALTPPTLQQDAQTKSPQQTLTEIADNAECEHYNDNDSGSDKELDDRETTWSPNSSQAKEVLLRQKCLEAALLKKKTAAMSTSCEDDETIVEDKETSLEDKETSLEDKETSLEERLRQRALESLLKNKH